MIAGYLRWIDVDPRMRPAFDPGRAAAIVRPLVAAAATARGPRFREALVESLHRELLIAFDPFPDGNARAARLALDHVLTRNGYALHVAEPAFIVSRTIEDRSLGWSLARVLDRLIGPSS